MNFFIGTVADGLTLGAIYSLAAVAFSLFCGTGGGFSFVPAGICLASAIVSAIVASWIWTFGPVFMLAAFVVSLLASITAGGAAGWLFGRANAQGDCAGIWPLFASVGVLFTAIGLLQFMSQLHIASHVPSPSPASLMLSVPGLFSVQIAAVQPLIIALAAASVGVVAFVVRKTHFGMLRRVVRYDATMAELLGADTARITSICTLMASALAAVSGWMLWADRGLPRPESGFLTIVCVLLAVVAGRMSSLKGSAVFGFLAGIGQTFWSAYFSPSYAAPAIFAVVLFLVRFFPERAQVSRPVEDI